MSTTLHPILLFPWGRAQAPTPGPPSPSKPLLVADISNYGGTLTDAQVEGLQAAGVAHVIARISMEDKARQAITRQQITALRGHGMPVSGYLFPDYSAKPATHIAEVLSHAGDISSLWIDIEGEGLPSFSVMADWIRAARSSCPVRMGIYTAAWVVRKFPGWGDLSDFPLWAAVYDTFRGFDVAFGGWTHAAGIQYQNTATVGGVSCDLSWFESEL